MNARVGSVQVTFYPNNLTRVAVWTERPGRMLRGKLRLEVEGKATRGGGRGVA